MIGGIVMAQVCHMCGEDRIDDDLERCPRCHQSLLVSQGLPPSRVRTPPSLAPEPGPKPIDEPPPPSPRPAREKRPRAQRPQSPRRPPLQPCSHSMVFLPSRRNSGGWSSSTSSTLTRPPDPHRRHRAGSPGQTSRIPVVVKRRVRLRPWHGRRAKSRPGGQGGLTSRRRLTRTCATRTSTSSGPGRALAPAPGRRNRCPRAAIATTTRQPGTGLASR